MSNLVNVKQIGSGTNGQVITTVSGETVWSNSSFTGNTSGNCITDIWVSNIHSCSPLNINPNNEGNIFFGTLSANTFDLTNDRLGIGIVASGSRTSTAPLDTLELGEGKWLGFNTTPAPSSTSTAGIHFKEGIAAGFNGYGVDMYYNASSGTDRLIIEGLFNNTRYSGMMIQRDGKIGMGMDLTGSTTTNTLQLGETGMNATFKFVDGNQASGYVLTSDGNGVGTWQTTSGFTNSPYQYNTGTTTAIEPKLGTNTSSGVYATIGGGTGNTATGAHSFIGGGADNTASGGWSHVEGYLNRATATGSHAEGINTSATTIGAHSEGGNTLASNQYSHAEGFASKATGQYTHAEGYTTTSTNSGSHAEGFQTTASGGASHAEGIQTTASGGQAHSEGSGTLASGVSSHAQNKSTTASGESSHAEGENTLAQGKWSHAGGYNTIAGGGGASYASGSGSTASGETSFIHSVSSLVTGDRSVVLGGVGITGASNDTVYVPNLNIDTTPSNDDALTQVLVRATDGTVKYRTASSIGGGPTKFSITTGFTASVDKTITHNLGTEDVVVNLWENSPKKQTDGEVVVVDSNNITVTMATTATFKVVVIG